MQNIIKEIGLLLPGKLAREVPKELKLPVELRWMILTMALTRFSLLCLSAIASELGNEKARELVRKGFADLLSVIGSPEAIKQLFGIEGDDTIAAAKLITAIDDILGNVEIIVESSPERTIVRNIDCRIWENRKQMRLEEKFPCVILCYESIKAVAEFINPKIDFRGSRDGSLVGIPGKSFNKCRIVGDDCCEVEYYIKNA